VLAKPVPAVLPESEALKVSLALVVLKAMVEDLVTLAFLDNLVEQVSPVLLGLEVHLE